MTDNKTEPHGSSQSGSLEQFANLRREQGRSIAVAVIGEPGDRGLRGRATAVRVAEILHHGEGSILDVECTLDFVDDDLCPGSVLLYRAGDPLHGWAGVVRSKVSLRSRGVHVVVFCEHVPPQLERLIDVRVDHNDGSPECYRVKFNPYDGETYLVELEGLV